MPDHARADTSACSSERRGAGAIVLIPTRLLIASGTFSPRLSAPSVAAAIARGVRTAGHPEPDLCPLDGTEEPDGFRARLDAVSFDARMRAARAVVIAAERLEERTLAGSAPFEIATRARQGGVPVYAITAHDELNAFDARILDLQLILIADGAKALAAAGYKLASEA
jgi:glycerate kinase